MEASRHGFKFWLYHLFRKIILLSLSASVSHAVYQAELAKIKSINVYRTQSRGWGQCRVVLYSDWYFRIYLHQVFKLVQTISLTLEIEEVRPGTRTALLKVTQGDANRVRNP